MKDYGPPITRPTILDLFPRLRNRLITPIQYRLLDAFDVLPSGSALSRLAARAARRGIGAYLYSVKVEVNDYCNLRCRMCYVRPGRADLPAQAISALFRQIRGCGVRVEILGGEPLLRPDICDVVRDAHAVGRSPFVSLYTNGVAATPETARNLRQAGLDAAIVSLVSHRAEVHDRFTGTPGSWAQTVRGIRNLRQAGVEVYTFTAVHRDNRQDYREVHSLVKERLDSHALFYQYIVQRPDDHLRIDAAEWAGAKHWVLKEQNRGHDEFLRRFFTMTGNACSGGNFVLTVKVDGSVQPCPFVSDATLGSILEHDIWTIHRNRFGKAAYHQFKTTPEECRACAYASVCAGGCRASNRALCGRYDRRDYLCTGPHRERFQREAVTDRVPCFF